MDEIGKIGARCASVKALRAGRVLARKYDEALRPVGLTGTQFTLLNVIAHYEPKSYAKISDLLDIDRTTLSRSLALLNKEGLVHLGAPGAKRKREVLLTTRGMEKLEAAIPYWADVQEKVEALFSPEEYKTLGELLGRLRELS